MGRRINHSALRSGITVLFGAVFLVNYVLQKNGVSTSFTRNYLDDLLAMPVILEICRNSMKILLKQPGLELNFPMISMAFLLFSVGMELVLPKYYNHITSDIVDVFCYAFGIIFYQIFFQKPVPEAEKID